MTVTEQEKPTGWWADAACRPFPTHWWFQTAVKNPTAEELRARSICETCPVRSECLRHALVEREKHGLWGGMTTDERDAEVRKIRRHHGRVPYEQIVERIAR